MHSFATILCRTFARVGSTCFLWSSSAVKVTSRSLGRMQCNQRNNNPGIRCASSRLRLLMAGVSLISGMSNAQAGTGLTYAAPAEGYQYYAYLFTSFDSLGAYFCSQNGYAYNGSTFHGSGGQYPDSRQVHCLVPNINNNNIPGDYAGETWVFHWRLNCELGPGWVQDFQHPEICVSGGAAPAPGKNAGPPPNCGEGNPINPGSSNKFQRETDYGKNGASPLTFERFYNTNGVLNPPVCQNGPGDWYRPGQYWISNCQISNSIGPLYMLATWTHTYSSNLRVQRSFVYAARSPGQTVTFTLLGGVWTAEDDTVDKLVQLTDTAGNTTGWRYTSADDDVELYNATGKLLSITHRNGLTQTLVYDGSGRLATVSDTFGRQLSFTYDASNRMQTMTDPAGGVYLYTYDTAGNVSSATYPDNTPAVSADNPKRVYLYNEAAYTSGASLSNTLTGITDENGVRFATWSYDGLGRAIGS